MSFLTTPDGTRLRYTDRGDGSAILLVHGWKGSHRVWDRAVHALSERFRVVAYDLRGMGESDKPRAGIDFETYAADVGFVIRELELSDVTLVGWSMGCSVSLEYMRLDGGGVGRLVLVAGPIKLIAAPDFSLAVDPDLFDSLIDEALRDWPRSERDFARLYFREPDERLTDWLYTIALQTPLDVALTIVRAQQRLDHRALLPRIETPTLAVYGAHDKGYPPELAEYIAESVPNGEHVIFDKSAHLPFLEETDRFHRVLADFVARHS